MPKFRVYGIVSGSKYLGEHEAKDKDDAEYKAMKQNGYVSLCHQCCRECDDPEIVECVVEEVE